MEFWKDLVARGEAAIEQLFRQQVPEGQRLECKRKSNPERPDLNADDRKNLGESLSALSNAEGGVVLWGIVDERGPDGLDYAKEAQPLVDAQLIAGKFATLTPEYLSPPNPDIEVVSIPFRAAPSSSVVAVRVGASDMRPHMSLAPDHRKYFLRVQSVNQPMVDFQVRDMLRVNTTPRLVLGYQLRPGAISGGNHESQFVLTLVNAGRVSASQPYVVVREGTSLHVVGPASKQFEEFKLSRQQERGFQGRLGLHPGHEVPAVAFLAHVKRINNEAHLRLNAATTDYVRWRDCRPVTIRVSVGAEHTPAREIEFTLDQKELEAMADSITEMRRTFHGPRKL